MSVHENNPQSTTPAPATPVAPGLPTGTETMRTSIFLPPMLQGMDQGPQLPSALSAAPSATALIRAFQRRWPLAIGAGLVAALMSALVICFVFPAKFASYYCVKINSTEPQNAIGERGKDADFNVFKTTQAHLAKIRPVILRALDMQINGLYIKDLGIVRAAGDPVEWLQGSIKTDFAKAPEIMTTTLSADQAEEVTLLLNALAESLIQENEIQDDKEHSARIEKTQAKAKSLQDEINRKRNEFSDKIKGLPTALNQTKKIDTISEELKEARKSLRDKQIEIAGVKVKLEQLEKRIESPEGTAPQWFLMDMLRQELDAEVYLKKAADSARDYEVTLARLGPNDPQIQSYVRKKEANAQALARYQRLKLPELTKKWRQKESAEAELEQRKLRGELDSLLQQEAFAKTSLDQLNSDFGAFQPKKLPPLLLSLENEIDSSEAALKHVNEKIQYMKINAPTPRVSILQGAILPNGKDTSRQMKLVGAGSVGMFLLTVLGVSFFEFRSRKITSSDEVKRGLGLNVIGTVPTLPDKARSPMAQTKLDPYWQNQLMESVDTIRTMLLHSARSNNTRVIMVTSAVGGEGKTSLSTQLAASLARAWKKTLLIDGDLRNPAAHKLFDVTQEPGFSEVLRGELSASEAVRSTPLSRLWVLPAGHWDSHAVQALAQDNVRTMLEELKQQYDFIILDSCPILPVADSLLLGQNVDSVLMTVMRDVSRAPAVYAAQQRLESLGIKMLGAVVIGAKNELGPLGYKYAYQARP